MSIHIRNKRSLVLSNVLPARSFRLSLLQMSNGRPHPDAAEPIIIGTEFGPWRGIHDISIFATSCKLAVKVSLLDIPTPTASGEGRHENLFVWDWRTGQKYIVSGIPGSSLAFVFELDLSLRITPTPQSVQCASLMTHVSLAWYKTDPLARKKWCYGTPRFWGTLEAHANLCLTWVHNTRPRGHLRV